MSEHLLLIDSSGFAFRAYYAFPPRYRESDGQPTGAVEGFMSMLWRLLGAAQADPPTMGAAVFDSPGKNFRHKIFPRYKANRPASRGMEVESQWAMMRHAAETLGLTPLEHPGFEADDVIATMAARAHAAGIRCTIVSSDKDFGQLVIDNHIEIVDPMKRVRKLEADVRKKFGVPPHLVPHVQALSGDTIDGIPGIPGLGQARAAALVRRFGSVDGVLKNVKECRWPQVRKSLRDHGKKAKTYLRLTTLRRDVPITPEWESLRLQPIMRDHLKKIVDVLGASARMDAIFNLDPQMMRVVDAAENPFQWWEDELIAPGQKIPDVPQCGFYERKLIAGGAFVPAKIWREPETDMAGEPTGREVLRCVVGGKPRDPNAEWTRLSMRPIRREAYKYEVADAEHAKAFRPNDPKADPTKPIDLLKAPIPRNPRAKRT